MGARAKPMDRKQMSALKIMLGLEPFDPPRGTVRKICGFADVENIKKPVKEDLIKPRKNNTKLAIEAIRNGANSVHEICKRTNRHENTIRRIVGILRKSGKISVSKGVGERAPRVITIAK